MAIDAISQAMSGSIWANYNTNNIPDWMMQRLMELGYKPEDISNLNEARDLIQKSESSSSSLNNSNDNSDRKSQNDSQESTIYMRAKLLAQKIGLNLSNNLTLREIISEISSALNALMQKSIAESNESMYEKIHGFELELSSIEQEVAGGLVSSQTVYSYMDSLAYQNMYAHKLNNF